MNLDLVKWINFKVSKCNANMFFNKFSAISGNANLIDNDYNYDIRSNIMSVISNDVKIAIN